MSVVESNVLIRTKDSSGNSNLFYPITKKDNVDGLDEFVRNQGVSTSGDGSAYTATVEGITSLTAGASFVMIPHVESTAVNPTLDVNGLGAKLLRRRTSSNTNTTTTGSSVDWLASGKPVSVMYDGNWWVVDLPRPNANDIMGTVQIQNGGTGATTAAEAILNLGISQVPECAAEDNGKVLCVVNGAPMWSIANTSDSDYPKVLFPPVDGWSAHQMFYYGSHSLGTCSFDNGVFTGSATTNHGAGMISPLVDLTDADILRIEFSASGAVDASTGQFCAYISSDNQNSGSGRVAEFVASSAEISAGTAIMDVSSLSGEYYIIAGVDVWGSGKSASCTISKVQLEKIADGGDIPFVTPEMFGAVGDGVADDTIALKVAVNSGRSVVGNRAKTYRCENLEVGVCSLENLNLVAVEACDYVIKLTNRRSTVRNIHIDGGNVAKVGIYGQIKGDSNDIAEVSKFAIYNCTEHGIYNPDLCCFWRHGFIGECHVGIYHAAPDTKFTDIVIRNAVVGVDGAFYNVTFERIHHWTMADYANNSIMFRANDWGGQSAFFHDCVADTVTYVMDCACTNAYFTVTNLSWIIHTGIYTANMTPPALLKQNTGKIAVSNSIFINSWQDANGNYPAFFPSDRSDLRTVKNSQMSYQFGGNPFDWPVSDILAFNNGAVQKITSLAELGITNTAGWSKQREVMFWFGLPAATYNGEAFTLKLTDASGNSLLDGSEHVQFDCYSKNNWEKPLLFLLQNDGGTLRFISPFAQEVSGTIYLRGILTINR